VRGRLQPAKEKRGEETGLRRYKKWAIVTLGGRGKAIGNSITARERADVSLRKQRRGRQS